MEKQSFDGAVYVHKLESACEPPSAEDMARGAYEMLQAITPSLKRKVAIKPNITIPADKDSGIVTHPDFVAGMVDYFLEAGILPENIMIAEGGGSITGYEITEHFIHSGYAEMARSRGVKIVNINSDEKIPVKLPQGEILKEIGIARTVKDDDTLFINVPKYKTHNLAVTTLCMKNLMGTITPSHDRHLCSIPKQYAKQAHEITPNGITMREECLCHKLCDLSFASKPDLNVIEGIIGRDGTAFRHGKNIQTNLVIAGKNTVSVDAVGSYLMGFDPRGIGYLKIAAQRGLGIIDIGKMRIYEARDGELIPCSDISGFMSHIPFEVLRWDKQPRNIPLNEKMLARLQPTVG